MSIRAWSTTASANNSAPPNGAPEGQTPGSVNNVIRQIMAEVRDTFEAAPFFDYGHTPTRVDADTFTVPTDLTAIYIAGRSVKLVGATTEYGTIVSSSYSNPTTTVEITGTVPTSLVTVSVGTKADPVRTPAEIAASVTPVNYAEEAGEWERYGVVVDAGGDQTAALQAAIDSDQPFVDLTRHAGTVNISSTLTIDRPIIFKGSGGCGGGNPIFAPGVNTTKLNYSGSGYAINITGGASGGGLQGQTNIHLSDFDIVCTSSALGGMRIGDTNYVRHSSFRNICIHDVTQSGRMGWWCKQVLKSLFENVIATNCYDGFLYSGSNTTITMSEAYAYTCLRYGYNIVNLSSGQFIGNSAAESCDDAAIYIAGNGAAHIDLLGFYIEDCNRTSGTAPINIGLGGSAPENINFFGLNVQSAVSGRSIDMDYGSNITFWNPELTTLAAGFARVTANTANCHFWHSSPQLGPSLITANAIGRMYVHSGVTPGRYSATMTNVSENALPFVGGILAITNVTSNKTGLIALNGSANSTTIIADPDSGFATTGTAGRIAVYHDSGQYRIYNEVGSSQNIVISVLNTDGM